MLLATYVDNVLIFWRDASGAEATFGELASFLLRTWGLKLPEASTEILVPRGALVQPAGAHKLSVFAFWATFWIPAP